jgi:hypothetical protein
MPLYHFDLRDDETFLVDDEGMGLVDLESTQIEAVESLSEMVKAFAGQSIQALRTSHVHWETRKDLCFN